MSNLVIKNKIIPIILSLIISTLVWLYVVSVENYDMQVPISNLVPVFVGEDVLLGDRELTVVDGKNTTVNITVRGKRVAVSRLTKENVTVRVDLSDITAPGNHRRAYDVEFPVDGIVIAEKDPYYIDLRVEKVSSKPIEIHPVFEGKIAEGYLAGEITLTPSTMTIEGPEAELARVASASVTINREAIDKELSGSFPFKLLGPGGDEVKSEAIKASIESVKVDMPVYKIKDIPLMVEVKEGGGAKLENVAYRIAPETIKVSGDAEYLNALNYISVGTIDLAQFYSSASRTFQIIVPNELTNLSGDTVAEVSVEIKGLTSRTLDCPNIELTNKPPDYDITVITNVIPTLIRGPSDDEAFALIMPGNLRAVADMSAVTIVEGQFSVPVTIYLDGYSNVGVVGEYKIVVEAAKK